MLETADELASLQDLFTTSHRYGSSPSSWGLNIAYVRVQLRWSVAYAFDVGALG